MSLNSVGRGMLKEDRETTIHIRNDSDYWYITTSFPATANKLSKIAKELDLHTLMEN